MEDFARLQAQLDPRTQEQVTGTVLKVLQEKEQQMDKHMADMEKMDEDDFERLRERRKAGLIKAQRETQKNISNGHGRYMELSDQKEFFTASKNSKQLVVHFYRSSTFRCQIVDRHLETLAQTHLETRFVKINVEKAPFLVEKLRIVMLPTILCVKDAKTEHSIIGFDEMGGTDDFPTANLAMVLSSFNVLTYDPSCSGEDADGIGRRGVNSIDMGSIRAGLHNSAADSEDDSDFEN